MESAMRALLIVPALIFAAPAFAATTLVSDLRIGQTATITGVVEAITDEDEFRLTDASGSVIVYIGGGIVPFNTGERVTIDGLVDRELGQIEVYARSAVRADGSSVSFDHRDD
jgi:uncharacterized protein YdeI (BOF family)